MDKKTKLIIIMNITLLCIAIGVSFAYFTSRSNVGSVESGVTGNTTTTEDAKLEIKSLQDFDDSDVYPGHQMVSIVKAEAKGNGDIIPYHLIWTGTNTLKTPIEYEVYKKDEQLEVNASCVKKVETVEGKQRLNEDCTISNLKSLGEAITSGTINYSSEEIKIAFVENESITATKPASSVYYYIIMKYPNLDKVQDEDLGASINGTVTLEKGKLDNESPVIENVETSTTKNSITINVTATDNRGVTKYYYVINNGEPIEKETNTHTFEGLTAGQSYEITIYAKDGANNESEKVTKTVTIVTGETTLARLNVTTNEGTPNFRSISCKSGCGGESTVGVYSAIDDTGNTSYYYRGDVINNYLKFANKWWRIIRINGDGTIRIIYDGNQYYANGASGTNAFVNETSYIFSKNGAYNHNAYVGFMYGSTDENATYEETHANINKSNAMEQLETWYATNLKDYEVYIDRNAGFCGDKRSSINSSATTPDNTGGNGTTSTYYGAYLRLYGNNKGNPSLTCNEDDLYTIQEASRGNKAMTYPIGLVTADESVMAGYAFATGTVKSYLNVGKEQWTMTPSSSRPGDTRVFGLSGGTDSSYKFFIYPVNNRRGLRPVINLRADVTITGSGTQKDPYEVS